MRTSSVAFGGLKGSTVPGAVLPEDGRRAGGCFDARVVPGRPPSRRGLSLRAPASRYGCGSKRCGTSTNQKHGVSALGLQRILGLGSYQTAWAWLHKFRRAMVRPSRDLLSGEVEVDETFLGGRDSDIDGRETDRSLIAIAVEIRGRGIGRIRMARLDDASADSLIPFVKSAVSEGSLVCTDGWAGYLPLSRHGYQHRPTSLRATGLPAQVVMPGVHRVASLLKRWWLGTYHGGISEQHLDDYLNEFTFRFNRRTSRARGLLFFRLVQQAVQMDAVPFDQIRGGNPNL